MKKSYEAMENFKNLSSRFDKQIRGIDKDEEKTNKEIAQLQADYDQLLIDEATLGESVDKTELNDLFRKISNRERDLQQYVDRRNVLEEKKKELLEDMIPDLYSGYKEKMVDAEREIINLRDEIIPLMSKYMNLLNKIGETYRGAHDIHDEFMSVTRGLTDEFESMYRFGIRVQKPGIFISSWPDSVDSRRGVTEQEQRDAVNGKGVPSPVALYNLTGIQEPNHQEAQRKYRKALQEKREDS